MQDVMIFSVFSYIFPSFMDVTNFWIFGDFFGMFIVVIIIRQSLQSKIIVGDFVEYKITDIYFQTKSIYYVLPPIGNQCRQFCTSLLQNLYYVPDSYFWSEEVYTNKESNKT
jgi:hypothetical protein